MIIQHLKKRIIRKKGHIKIYALCRIDYTDPEKYGNAFPVITEVIHYYDKQKAELSLKAAQDGGSLNAILQEKLITNEEYILLFDKNLKFRKRESRALKAQSQSINNPIETQETEQMLNANAPIYTHIVESRQRQPNGPDFITITKFTSRRDADGFAASEFEKHQNQYLDGAPMWSFNVKNSTPVSIPVGFPSQSTTSYGGVN